MLERSHPRGHVWAGVNDWVEEEVWRALNSYLHRDEETFVAVEGDEIEIHLGGILCRKFPLKEALLWDVDGHKHYDGKICLEDAEAIANLRKLRDLLADVIAEIENALPSEREGM